MRTAKPLKDRLLAKIAVAEGTGCWLWTGPLRPDGYVQIQVVGRGLVYAHRVAYEEWIGPIPEGLTLDHVHARGCRHRHCMNPAHLEPVTHAENMRRSATTMRAHCPQNHPYDEENTGRGAKGERVCRICSRATKRRYKERQRALAVVKDADGRSRVEGALAEAVAA